MQHNPVFIYNGKDLEIDDSFVYLGAMFSYNGRFQRHNQGLVDQACKSVFVVISKARRLHLPTDIQIQLFDSVVVPILLYGSEVSGFESCNVLKRLCIQFYKLILKAKNQQPISCYTENLDDILLVFLPRLEWWLLAENNQW